MAWGSGGEVLARRELLRCAEDARRMALRWADPN
jgi:hypothetical protein